MMKREFDRANGWRAIILMDYDWFIFLALVVGFY